MRMFTEARLALQTAREERALMSRTLMGTCA